MIRDYIIKETLGKGAYGVVYKVEKKNTNNIYVIKQISLKGLTTKEINEVNQEAKILNLINSDFVVKYYDSFKENNNINIVMEYCDGGDLNDFLIEKKEIGKLLEEDLIWKIFIKITIGLADIHKIKILHRDLKTLNIFLKKDLQIKIGDLGVAKILLKNSFAKTIIGTPYYLSPEICEEKPYNDKSDVWALGCILYELCTFRHPFEAKSHGALILKILNNKPDPIDNSYSSDLKNLIFLLLDKNSQKRPSCAEILKNSIVLNKVKSLGLYDYIVKMNNSEQIDNNKNYNNNVKISKKVLDFNSFNINKKYYNKGIGKENIHIPKNVINCNLKKENCKKHVSAVNLLDNIKNHNLKFNNINQQIIHKRKNSDFKINVITIGEIKNQRPVTSAVNNNNPKKKPFLKNNYFLINNNDKITNNKKIKNEKVFQSKKYNINQENSNNNEKKILHPVNIIFKNMNISPNKQNNSNIKNENKLNEEKKIKDNNIKKYIPKYKFAQKENKYNDIPLRIKQIPYKDLKLNNKKDNEDSIPSPKIDKYQMIFSNQKNKEKEKSNLLNNKKKFNIKIVNNNNKNNLISSSSKSNNTYNNNKIIKDNKDIKKETNDSNKHNENNKNNNTDNNNINKDSILENDDNIIFNDIILSPNFQIINNTEQNLSNNNTNKSDFYNKNIKVTNENEDSIDENIIINEKVLNRGIYKEKNKIYSDNDNSEENEEENVKEIKETNNKENKKDSINKEIYDFKEKIKKNKNEMLQLIGEKDYKYIMNLYNIGIKEQNKIDEIYINIEEYANKNYSIEKKELFCDIYLRLVSLECQLSKKIEELNIN